MGKAPGTMVWDTTPRTGRSLPHATAIRYHPRPPPARPRRRAQPPGHHRRLPGRRPSLARRRPQPHHDRLPVPAPGPARQHRLSARRPLRRLDLLRQRLLPGPPAVAPGSLAAPPGGHRDAPAAHHRAGQPLARSSGLDRRRLQLLDARRPRLAAALRPAPVPTPGVRLPPGQAPGRLRPLDRPAPAGGGRPAVDPRDEPTAGRARGVGPGRWPAGRPRLLLVRAPGPPGAAGAPRRAPPPSAPARGLPARARPCPPRPVGQPGQPAAVAMGPGPGGEDQVVVWFKPKRRPAWLTPAEFAALPDELVVRELRYRVEAPGFRTQSVILVTTLLDAEAYPASALADLYRCRWRIEGDLKHLKITMGMDVLRC